MAPKVTSSEYDTVHALSFIKSVHNANLADRKTSLNVTGEIHVIFQRGDRTFTFNGLVVDELDSEILAGVPFIARNDIIPQCKNKEIIFRDNGEVIKYSYKTKSNNARQSGGP